MPASHSPIVGTIHAHRHVAGAGQERQQARDETQSWTSDSPLTGREVGAASRRPSALTSARVVWSRIRAVASRTSFIASRTPQVRSSTHSAHFIYAVWLTQGTGCERPFQHPNHVAERDLGRTLAQKVAAALPLLALHQAVALQLEQDRLPGTSSESRRDPPAPRRARGRDPPSRASTRSAFRAVLRLPGQQAPLDYQAYRLSCQEENAPCLEPGYGRFDLSAVN